MHSATSTKHERCFVKYWADHGLITWQYLNRWYDIIEPIEQCLSLIWLPWLSGQTNPLELQLVADMVGIANLQCTCKSTYACLDWITLVWHIPPLMVSKASGFCKVRRCVCLVLLPCDSHNLCNPIVINCEPTFSTLLYHPPFIVLLYLHPCWFGIAHPCMQATHAQTWWRDHPTSEILKRSLAPKI